MVDGAKACQSRCAAWWLAQTKKHKKIIMKYACGNYFPIIWTHTFLVASTEFRLSVDFSERKLTDEWMPHSICHLAIVEGTNWSIPGTAPIKWIEKKKYWWRHNNVAASNGASHAVRVAMFVGSAKAIDNAPEIDRVSVYFTACFIASRTTTTTTATANV